MAAVTLLEILAFGTNVSVLVDCKLVLYFIEYMLELCLFNKVVF